MDKKYSIRREPFFKSDAALLLAFSLLINSAFMVIAEQTDDSDLSARTVTVSASVQKAAR